MVISTRLFHSSAHYYACKARKSHIGAKLHLSSNPINTYQVHYCISKVLYWDIACGKKLFFSDCIKNKFVSCSIHTVDSKLLCMKTHPCTFIWCDSLKDCDSPAFIMFINGFDHINIPVYRMQVIRGQTETCCWDN